MGNKRICLTLQQEAVYKKYIEDQGRVFNSNKNRRYRIKPELAQTLFSRMPDVPDGHLISGKSTLYDAKGNQLLQWVKTSQDKEQREKIIQALIDGLNSKVDKATPIKESIKHYNSDLLNQYTITDMHLGMMAWGEESGDDWDLKIAEKTLINWFKQAIESSPDAETCVFAQIGDFLHWDGLDAVTPASGHILDADSRFTKLVRVAIRVLREITSMLLKKHKFVHIIQAEGNHDTASSVWLRETLNFYYEDEPRVTVDTNPDPYYAYMHGSTLLFYHHGHKRNIARNLDSVLVSKFKDLFGASKNVYAHTGHLHHEVVKETSLMIIEQHRTLAAKDSYAARGGWLSGRDAKVITYRKDLGEVARITINVDMIK